MREQRCSDDRGGIPEGYWASTYMQLLTCGLADFMISWLSAIYVQLLASSSCQHVCATILLLFACGYTVTPSQLSKILPPFGMLPPTPLNILHHYTQSGPTPSSHIGFCLNPYQEGSTGDKLVCLCLMIGAANVGDVHSSHSLNTNVHSYMATQTKPPFVLLICNLHPVLFPSSTMMQFTRCPVPVQCPKYCSEGLSAINTRK